MLCYGVYDLGRVIQYGRPSLEVDSRQQAHVLHQSGPAHYTHTVISVDGALVNREYFSGVSSTIRLEPNNRGDVEIKGMQDVNSDATKALDLDQFSR